MQTAKEKKRDLIQATLMLEHDKNIGHNSQRPSPQACNLFRPSPNILKQYALFSRGVKAQNKRTNKEGRKRALAKRVKFVNDQIEVMPFNQFPAPYLHRQTGLPFESSKTFKWVFEQKVKIFNHFKEGRWDRGEKLIDALSNNEYFFRLYVERLGTHSPLGLVSGIDGAKTPDDYRRINSSTLDETKCVISKCGYSVPIPNLRSRLHQHMHASIMEVLLAVNAPDILYGTFNQSREMGIQAILKHLASVKPGERSFHLMRLRADSTASYYKSPLQNRYKEIGYDICTARTIMMQGDNVCVKLTEIHEPIETVMGMAGELNPMRQIMLQESFSHVVRIKEEFEGCFMVLIGNELLLSLPSKPVTKELIIGAVNYALQTGTGTHHYTVAADTYRKTVKQFDYSGLTFWKSKEKSMCRPSNTLVEELRCIYVYTKHNPGLRKYYLDNFLYYYRHTDLKNVMKKIQHWKKWH